MPTRTNDGLKKRCSCGRKKWPTCHHPWHFGFHHGGTEHRLSLDKVARARGERPPRTKADANGWRDRLRADIRAGTFPVRAPEPETRLTVAAVCDVYLREHVRIPTRRPRGRREMEILISLMRRAEVPGGDGQLVKLETKAIAELTRADVEAVRAWRRAQQQARESIPGVKGGEVGINRLLSRFRHLCNWAIGAGYCDTTPFKRGTVAVVKLATAAESARNRRLDPTVTLPDGTVRPGEEARLLAKAEPHLRALIVAALSTGCRVGELLSLQWAQIRNDEKGEARWLDIRAEKAKTATGRTIPIGPRLRAELSMRRHAPDGTEHPSTAYVFGNEVGEQVTSVRVAWDRACEAAGIHDLHFHDLRREFASRLLETKADLHDAKTLLGHANIATTSRYLESTPIRLTQVLERLDSAFAHDSHKSASETMPAPADSSRPLPANSLN